MNTVTRAEWGGDAEGHWTNGPGYAPRRARRQFPPELLRRLAENAGVELTACPEVSGQFRGNCPFHAPPIDTFAINVEKNRFHCIYCHRAGGVVVLAAHLWKTSTSEAGALLREMSGSDPPATRPTLAGRREVEASDVAIINRLMQDFRKDMAVNRHAANVCRFLDLAPRALANAGVGWCWPGRPVGARMLTDGVTLSELESSNVVHMNSRQEWTTSLPGGFVLPERDRHGLVDRVVGYDPKTQRFHHPSGEPVSVLGLRQYPGRIAALHITDEPIVYLKALVLDVPAALICDGWQLEAATDSIVRRGLGAARLYTRDPATAAEAMALLNCPEAAGVPELFRSLNRLPRRLLSLQDRREALPV